MKTIISILVIMFTSPLWAGQPITHGIQKHGTTLEMVQFYQAIADDFYKECEEREAAGCIETYWISSMLFKYTTHWVNEIGRCWWLESDGYWYSKQLKRNDKPWHERNGDCP